MLIDDSAFQHQSESVEEVEYFLVGLMDGHNHSGVVLLDILLENVHYDVAGETV